MLRIYIMLLFIIKWAIISFILIVLIHYLYSFFKTTLTIPKVRDLVNKPTERYNEMIDTIKYNDSVKYNDSLKYKDNNKDTMQDELSNFLQDLKKNKNVSSEIVSSNDGHSNTFSNY
jgi:hypothetical protein